MDYVVFSCRLCPHYQEALSVNNDHCDCEGNACEEGCFLLTRNEDKDIWETENKDIILYKNRKL